MKEIKVKLTLTEECLGMSPSNQDIYTQFIASKSPDASTREEEVAAIGADEVERNEMTIFPRNEFGEPFLWDYQIRGFFKDSCSALKRCPGEDFAKESVKMKAYKKIIDGCIFVKERKVPFEIAGDMGVCQRSLRTSNAQGERTALASSESIPAGSSLVFTIICLSDQYEKPVIEWLDYGKFKGLGQWRNSGKGRFDYEILK